MVTPIDGQFYRISLVDDPAGGFENKFSHWLERGWKEGDVVEVVGDDFSSGPDNRQRSVEVRHLRTDQRVGFWTYGLRPMP